VLNLSYLLSDFANPETYTALTRLTHYAVWGFLRNL
jgi:hypothetical protein